jgi:hypothetical protein
MSLTETPQTQPHIVAGYSNDAGTLVQLVSPSNPLPVSPSAPSGTQDVNIKQVNGHTVLEGAGATGNGSQRVTIAQDSTTVGGASSLPAGTNIIGKVGIDQTTPGTTNGVVVTSSLPAGTNNIGNVGGKTVSVTVTPTVTASNSYGTNYVVGGLLTFANALTATGSGIIQSVSVTCKKVETSGFTLTFFKSNPSNTTWTDAAAAAINASDVSALKTTVPLTASSVLGTCTILSADGLGIAASPGATSVYAVLTSNASLTNQFGSTSDITVTITILQDL